VGLAPPARGVRSSANGSRRQRRSRCRPGRQPEALDRESRRDVASGFARKATVRHVRYVGCHGYRRRQCPSVIVCTNGAGLRRLLATTATRRGSRSARSPGGSDGPTPRSRRICMTRRTITKGLRIAPRALTPALALRALRTTPAWAHGRPWPRHGAGAFAGPGLRLSEQARRGRPTRYHVAHRRTEGRDRVCPESGRAGQQPEHPLRGSFGHTAAAQSAI